MKRVSVSLLSVLLAVALAFVSMPKAQAAESIGLSASGVIYQSIDVEETGLVLATVTDWQGEWGPCYPVPSARDVFRLPAGVYLQPGSVFGKPGSSGTYEFTLHNEYAAAIRYKLDVTKYLGADPQSMVKALDGEPFIWTLTGAAAEGELAVGESAAFVLTWFWNGKPEAGSSETEAEKNSFDTVFGVQSKLDDRTLYKVLMEFYVEADELPQPPNRPRFPWWTLLIPPALGLPLLGLPLLGLPLLGLPLLAAPLALLRPGPTEVSPSPPEEDIEPPYTTGPIMPPKTGDSGTVMLMALLALGMSMAGIAAISRKKRKYEEA